MVLYREKFHKPQVFLGVGVCVEIDGEGEINIYDKETKEGLKKHLKIKKMTSQKYSENELPLRKER